MSCTLQDTEQPPGRGLHHRGARAQTPSPRCDNQKHLQTWPDVPEVTTPHPEDSQCSLVHLPFTCRLLRHPLTTRQKVGSCQPPAFSSSALHCPAYHFRCIPMSLMGRPSPPSRLALGRGLHVTCCLSCRREGGRLYTCFIKLVLLILPLFYCSFTRKRKSRVV